MTEGLEVVLSDLVLIIGHIAVHKLPVAIIDVYHWSAAVARCN